MPEWNIEQSAELYGLGDWGADAFAINAAGHVAVRPNADGAEIDLRALVDDLQRRGLRTPILLRFSDILASRIESLAGAFDQAVSASTSKP